MGKNDKKLYVPLNGDDSEEWETKGLTSAGIKDAAHHTSRGAE